jgi:hypothetical protein
VTFPARFSAFILAASLAAAAPAQSGDWPAADAPPAALASLFPNSATVQRRLLAAAHEARDAAAVQAGLNRLAALGYSPTEATLGLLALYLPEAELTALRLRFNSNQSRVQASILASRVPAEFSLIEGVAWDSESRRLFATSVVGRALLQYDGARWRRVALENTGSLSGLALDPRRGGVNHLLWVASGVFEQTPSPEGAFRGLIGVDIRTLREVRRIAAPEGASPSDIAIDGLGTLYASDPLSGAVYRARRGEAALSVLIPPGRLASPQGLAPTANGRWLYISDYGRGIALLDQWNNILTRVGADAATMLDGIDGLAWFRGGLIAIQNGTRPHRILLLRLSADGHRIASVRVLESDHEEWGEPTLGAVRGNAFLYVADAQWERYGPGGGRRDAEPPRPTAIRLLRP